MWRPTSQYRITPIEHIAVRLHTYLLSLQYLKVEWETVGYC